MAEETEAAAAKIEAKGGTPLIPLVIAMVMTVGGAVGGAMYWLTKSGRLPVQGGGVQTVQAAAKTEPVKTRMMVLEPLLVNLADAGGAGYLRVVVALRVEDPPPAKDAKPKEEKPPEKGKLLVNEDEVLMRDAALAVVGRETSERLLADDGKEQLKSELRTAFVAHVPEVKVVDVLFTEFLVQR